MFYAYTLNHAGFAPLDCDWTYLQSLRQQWAPVHHCRHHSCWGDSQLVKAVRERGRSMYDSGEICCAYIDADFVLAAHSTLVIAGKESTGWSYADDDISVKRGTSNCERSGSLIHVRSSAYARVWLFLQPHEGKNAKESLQKRRDPSSTKTSTMKKTRKSRCATVNGYLVQCGNVGHCLSQQ